MIDINRTRLCCLGSLYTVFMVHLRFTVGKSVPIGPFLLVVAFLFWLFWRGGMGRANTVFNSVSSEPIFDAEGIGHIGEHCNADCFILTRTWF